MKEKCVDFNVTSSFIDGVFDGVSVSIVAFKTVLSIYNSLFIWCAFVFNFKCFLTPNWITDCEAVCMRVYHNMKQNKQKIHIIKSNALHKFLTGNFAIAIAITCTCSRCRSVYIRRK